MNYCFYIDNVARYQFFKKLITSENKNSNCTFVVDLISSYFYLDRYKKESVLFFTSNDWEILFSKVFGIKYISYKDLTIKKLKNHKIIIWNGSHRKQPIFIKKLNKNTTKVFIENANINNLFQYGYDGIGPFHETCKYQKSDSNVHCISKFDITKLLNKSKPANLNGLGRESYSRNVIAIFIDFIFTPITIIHTLKNLIYDSINKIAKGIICKLKFQVKYRETNSNFETLCVILQVHNDSSLINSGFPSYVKLIKKLIKKYNNYYIYLKPHPLDFLYALFLRILFFKKTRFDFSNNLSSLIKKNYSSFHTISSSFGFCIASNTNKKVFFYGISPFIKGDSKKFITENLVNVKKLSKLIF